VGLELDHRTNLVLDEILLDVPVEKAYFEDDIGVRDALRHVEVAQGVTHQHDVLPALELGVVDGALRLRGKGVVLNTYRAYLYHFKCKANHPTTIIKNLEREGERLDDSGKTKCRGLVSNG
jgi:hypothetical protein